MAEDMGEKTEQPTGKRLSDAREKGQVGKSQDLAAAILMIGAVVMMVFFAQSTLMRALAITRHNLSPEQVASSLVVGDIVQDLIGTAYEFALIVAPFMGVMLLVAWLSHFLQIGFLLSTKALEPKLEKLDPIKGLKRLFSKRSIIKGGLDLLKFVLVGGIGYIALQFERELIAGLPSLTVMEAVIVTGEIILRVAMWALLMLLILGIADYAYQKWQRTQDLKMTKHEVKDERKSMEGDMEQKAKRLRMGREIAMQRLQMDVPKADVIVTNPTHYAVALKYDKDTMEAPRVLAKGGDFMAMRIRQIATTAGVPIVERPPLARALYHNVDVGQQIHPEHFEAVAEVLAYVYRLDGRIAS
ncbi:MAG: flagellar biosynthesis protein FlhB [Phycisphaerales bacterium JB065]